MPSLLTQADTCSTDSQPWAVPYIMLAPMRCTAGAWLCRLTATGTASAGVPLPGLCLQSHLRCTSYSKASCLTRQAHPLHGERDALLYAGELHEVEAVQHVQAEVQVGLLHQRDRHRTQARQHVRQGSQRDTRQALQLQQPAREVRP